MERNIDQKTEQRQLTKGEQMFKDLNFREYRHLIDPVPEGSFVTQDNPEIGFVKEEKKPEFNGWKEEITTYIVFDIWSKKMTATEISRKEKGDKRDTSYSPAKIDSKLLSAINQMFIDLEWR